MIIIMCDILFLLLKNKPHLSRVTALKIYGLAMNYDNLLRKKSISQIFHLFILFCGVCLKDEKNVTIHQCDVQYFGHTLPNLSV